MILTNFYKAYNSIRTTDANRVPLPLNGGTSDNAWMRSQSGWNTHPCQETPFSLTTHRDSTGDPSAHAEMNWYAYKKNLPGSRGWFVDVGFGNTPPTKNDYHLESSNAERSTPYLTHVSGKNYIWEIPDSDKTCMVWVESTYRNNDVVPYTVTEIGLVWAVGSSNTSWLPADNWTGNNYMIARKVLSNPVTVQPNEEHTFTYKLKFKE